MAILAALLPLFFKILYATLEVSGPFLLRILIASREVSLVRFAFDSDLFWISGTVDTKGLSLAATDLEDVAESDPSLYISSFNMCEKRRASIACSTSVLSCSSLFNLSRASR